MADFAFFEVWQDDNAKVIHYRRIASPRDKLGATHSTAYFDADLLAAEADKNGSKITRSAIPGDWALKQNGVAVDTWKHNHDFTVPFV